jgi:methyl-accepting chemotaxis protein
MNKKELPVLIITIIAAAGVAVPPALCYALAGNINDPDILAFVRVLVLRTALVEGIITALGFLGILIALGGRGKHIRVLGERLASLTEKKETLEKKLESSQALAAENGKALSGLQRTAEEEKALLFAAVSGLCAQAKNSLEDCFTNLDMMERIFPSLEIPPALPSALPPEKPSGEDPPAAVPAGSLAEEADHEILRQKLSEGEERAGAANRIIVEIAEGIEKITGLAGIISQISARTNMLSMNAAIESAHAGSAGAGFAVVAGEIKKLAESTAANAKEIQTQIRVMSEKTRAGLEAGDRSLQAIGEIGGAAAKFEAALVSMLQKPANTPVKISEDPRPALVDREALKQALAGTGAELQSRLEQFRLVLDAARISIEAISGEAEYGGRGVAVKEAPRSIP